MRLRVDNTPLRPGRAASGIAGFVVVAMGLLLTATPANAEPLRPWWHLSGGSRPTHLPAAEGENGELILEAANLGDASADGEAAPVVFEDHVPAGLELRSVEGVAGQGSGANNLGPVSCKKEPGNLARCTFRGKLPPYTQIEYRVKVKTREAHSGELNEVTVSGGNAKQASAARPVFLSSLPTPFGVEEYALSPEQEGGGEATQAGSHPFQLTTAISLNQAASSTGEGAYEAHPVATAKDTRFHWPAGLIGNPAAVGRCSLAQFLTVVVQGSEVVNACPAQSAVGVSMVTVEEPHALHYGTLTVPIFNLEPASGEPARFGFFIGPIGVPVMIDSAVRSDNGEDYGIDVDVTNINQIASFLSAKVTVWGVPGDPRHAAERGWNCLEESGGKTPPEPCQPIKEPRPQAFLTLPSSCSGSPLLTSAEADSWLEPNNPATLAADPSMPTLDGCNQLSFTPAMSAQPTTVNAAAPSGLEVNIDFHDEGLASGTGVAESQLKNTVVTLPEGFTINPSSGVGLAGCTQADYARETVNSFPGAGCPNESKLGTVEIETPLLKQKIDGNIFIAQPYENPFPEPTAGHPNGTLVALYIIAKNRETGVLIKLAGKVTPNPVIGQLTTTFENNPQLPFSHFNFHFREGQQAPLISPSTCGTYKTQAQLTPWSAPLDALTETSSFTVTKGFDGGECPSGGSPPFHPGIVSGTLNNNAGSFSPFYLHLTRTDAEQEIAGFSTNLPPGLTGDLTGVPFCPETDIEAARRKTGTQEEAEPSCPAASQIGHTLVGTGVGAVLAYVPGKLYLAGPFHGAPFSIVSVTSAKVGPFDLGTVVLRFGLSIDPITAQVSVTPTNSEPIPTIIKGIVTHVRDIRVYVDRSNFAMNPTSCEPMAIGSTLNSDLGASATASSRFQAANCASLKFKPKFSASTSAKTSRTNGASLHVSLLYPKAPFGTQANIAKVHVELPKALPSRLSTLNHACLDSVFNQNPASCPAQSRVGYAKAVTPVLPVPLEGPAYFVSHGGQKFPELIVVLQGYGVTVYLEGETFINKAGITSSTFKSVPDVPVGSFELTLPQGQFSALAANTDLCTTNLAMPTTFDAQNGATLHQNTQIEVQGCPYALRIVHRKLHKRTLTLKVSVPAAGKLAATGKGVSGAVKSAKGHQTLTLTLKERHAGKLRTTIQLRFTPHNAAGKQRGKQAKILRKSLTVTFG